MVALRSDVQLESSKHERTQRVRTEPLRSGPGLAACGRAALAPGGAARAAVAGQLDAVLLRRRENGDEWASGRAIAARCGVDERIVRQWRNGETAIPIAALLVMPPSLAAELVSELQAQVEARAARLAMGGGR